MSKLKKGQIVVTTFEQKVSCGIVTIHEGEIVRVKRPNIDGDGDIIVVRADEVERYCRIDKVRPLEEHEIKPAEEAYNSGERYFKNVKISENV